MTSRRIILSRAFAEIVYGRDNPYGWRMEYEHIDNIQRDDLMAFYQALFLPVQHDSRGAGRFLNRRDARQTGQAIRRLELQAGSLCRHSRP